MKEFPESFLKIMFEEFPENVLETKCRRDHKLNGTEDPMLYTRETFKVINERLPKVIVGGIPSGIPKKNCWRNNTSRFTIEYLKKKTEEFQIKKGNLSQK